MGAVDTGCTTLLAPLSVAKLYNLDIRPLSDPFVMHFENGTFANITHGVSRSLNYIYNFMAVSDKISRVLIDIKQPARAGLTFFADAKRASLFYPNHHLRSKLLVRFDQMEPMIEKSKIF